MDIIALLGRMQTEEASDLFVAVGKPPALRVYGKVNPLAESATQTQDFDCFLAEYFPTQLKERLAEERDLDIGLSVSADSRFRLNLFYQRGQLAMVARRVPSGALDFSELGLPSVVQSLAESPRGLILVTGATGSGKSTTMAAILHHINSTFAKHIVTVEDPIEFIHDDLKSVVTQREIGNDTTDFSTSLRHVVRQSPDVIFLGELRDFETIQTAISAAMTGHLVVTTMHTIDTFQTVERVISFFPNYLREQIALDFAASLRGIISQRLVARADGNGVVPALEILVATPLIRRLIANRQLDDLPETLKADNQEEMQTFTRSLVQLHQASVITLEAGAAAATNREEFLLAVQGMETGIDTLRQRDGETASGKLSMRHLLKSAIRHGASDLLLTTGSAPILRIDGVLCELRLPSLTSIDTQRLLFGVLAPQQRVKFESAREIDFALSIRLTKDKDDDSQSEPGESHRFRVNGFYQKGAVAGAIRVIPQTIPAADELGLPPVLMDLSSRHHGLILVTGATGHGKSTTLACIIDQINSCRSCHIITVEDPIEYVHRNKKAVIDQREVFADTLSFKDALKYVLRQDPDVILVGEMRDQETIGAAITAAETGHLVLATLHTNDASQTIDRIIDSFPPYQQGQVRSQLAACIVGVVAQRLLPRADGKGRVACFEIMLGTPPVQALIRDNRTHQLLTAIETGGRDGMISMDKALMNLYNKNMITRQTVKLLCRDKNLL